MNCKAKFLTALPFQVNNVFERKKSNEEDLVLLSKEKKLKSLHRIENINFLEIAIFQH